jgi:hypothetical protein
MKSHRIEGHRLPHFSFKEVVKISVVANQLSRGSATKLCSMTVSPTAEPSGGARINAVGEMSLDVSLETASSLLPFDRALGTEVIRPDSAICVLYESL